MTVSAGVRSTAATQWNPPPSLPVHPSAPRPRRSDGRPAERAAEPGSGWRG